MMLEWPLPVITQYKPMPRIEHRERAAETGVDRIQDALKAGGLVEGFAEGVGGGELQAMRKAFIKGRLQRVVRRIGDRILGEDAAKDGDSVTRAASASQRIALRGRVPTQPDQTNSVWRHIAHQGSPWNHRRSTSSIRQVQSTRW